MKAATITILIISFLGQLVYSQSVKKITVNDNLHTNQKEILPGDIAYGGTAHSLDASVMGYSWRTTQPRPVIGLLDILDNGAMYWNRSYSVNNTNLLEIKKIAPVRSYIDNTFYVLSTYGSGTGLQFMPVVMSVDNATGNIINQHLLNVPNNEQAFTACDLLIDYDKNVAYILCVGWNFNAHPFTNVSSLYLVVFNMTTAKFSTTRIYNLANLSGVYDWRSNFIRGYHYGLEMNGLLSFYGIEKNIIAGQDRGVVFNRDFNSVDNAKAYYVNGNSTQNIQVNITDGANQTIAVQNSSGDIYLDHNEYLTTNYWTKKYNRSFPLFYFLGYSHGVKNLIDRDDYFLGHYGQPQTGSSGYGFFRYDYTNGTLDQTYRYDLNFDWHWLAGDEYSWSYFDHYRSKYFFIGHSRTMPSHTYQHFYFIENDITQDQTDCVISVPFTEANFPVEISNITYTFNTYSIDVDATPFNAFEIFPHPLTIEPICSDSETGRQSADSIESNENVETITSLLTQHLKTMGKQASARPVAISQKQKNIASYNIYNTSGQLVKTVNNIQKGTLLPDRTGLLNTTVYLVEYLYNDGTRETKKLFFQ